MKPRHAKSNPAVEAFNEGYTVIKNHPIFRPMVSQYRLQVVSDRDYAQRYRLTLPQIGLATVTSGGTILCNPTKRASPGEWVYALAHNLLHLGFDQFQIKEHPREWNLACDCFVARFLADIKLGTPPETIRHRLDLLPRKSEEQLYASFCANGVPPELMGFGTGDEVMDMIGLNQYPGSHDPNQKSDWADLFALGLSHAVSGAVYLAAGKSYKLDGSIDQKSMAQEAKDWFVSSYPLLGALATSFNILFDIEVCDRMDIGVAAVSYLAQEIYINPAAGLSARECRFVMAHELLHVGLRHDARVQDRDPYLWNVACDFVINGWLMEMEVGDMPGVGGLYDPALKGLSAETIYDRLATDIRKSRKLMTLRNRIGQGDIIDMGDFKPGLSMDLEDAVRRALYQGLEYHEEQNRGFLPANLVEEIRATNHPPIPWDVKLAEWFQGHFAPLEKRRSYARLSRRQSSTPHIPRPNWYYPHENLEQRTFGVVIDTSGSMDRVLLGKALGAIASYSQANDVSAARVIFCDARVYDEGFMPPDQIAGHVKVRGRGGTVLQPAIDHLQKADDFPEEGPILIITDGYCDRLSVRREHAFLIPKSAKLPFPPRGPVFRFE